SCQVRRVRLVSTLLSRDDTAVKPDCTEVRTIWGELAWQLRAPDRYAMLAEADRLSTNPGAALGELNSAYTPCLILIDEWVAYARLLYDRDELPAGTFHTQFTFAQTLTEEVTSTPGTLLAISISAYDA